MFAIKIADVSLRETEETYAARMGFGEKLEMAKLLEKLRIDVIETGFIGEDPADAAFIRTLAATLNYSTISVPVALDQQSVDRTWNALSNAKRPRLCVSMPTSTVQMEYLHQMKADAALPLAEKITGYCAAHCRDVEFAARDATRSEPAFLAALLKAVIKKGATTITLCDSVGEMLPEEMGEFISSVYEAVPELRTVTLSLHCTDNLGLAAACAIAGIKLGAVQIKLSSHKKLGTLSLEKFLNVIKVRGESLGVSYDINDAAFKRICAEIDTLMNTSENSEHRRAWETEVR